MKSKKIVQYIAWVKESQAGLWKQINTLAMKC